MGNQLQLALPAHSSNITTRQQSISYPVPLSLLSSGHAAHGSVAKWPLCLPLGTGLAHILPPTPWKPWLLLVFDTLLDRI